MSSNGVSDCGSVSRRSPSERSFPPWSHPPALVIASGVAFALSELADCAVYTPLQQRRLVLAVIASAAVGLVVDSIVFLWLAFGSLDFLPGQIIGKAWAVLFAIPFVRLLRRVAPTAA